MFDTVNLMTFRSAAHLVSLPLETLAEEIAPADRGGPTVEGFDGNNEPLFSPRDFVRWWVKHNCEKAHAKWTKRLAHAQSATRSTEAANGTQ
jgi:hypothetical protein